MKALIYHLLFQPLVWVQVELRIRSSSEELGSFSHCRCACAFNPVLETVTDEPIPYIRNKLFPLFVGRSLF
jgi:hypothetical protein